MVSVIKLFASVVIGSLLLIPTFVCVLPTAQGLSGYLLWTVDMKLRPNGLPERVWHVIAVYTQHLCVHFKFLSSEFSLLSFGWTNGPVVAVYYQHLSIDFQVPNFSLNNFCCTLTFLSLVSLVPIELEVVSREFYTDLLSSNFFLTFPQLWLHFRPPLWVSFVQMKLKLCPKIFILVF